MVRLVRLGLTKSSEYKELTHIVGLVQHDGTNISVQYYIVV